MRVAAMNNMPWSVESATAHVLGEHARLSAMATELAHAMCPEHPSVEPSVKGRAAALRAELDDYMRIEEDELIPLLASADAWGPIRVQRLRARHARTVAVLDMLVSELSHDHVMASSLAARVHELVRTLLRELDEAVTALDVTDPATSVVVDQTDG